MTETKERQLLRIPQAVYGKHLEKVGGRVATKSKLGFLAASADFPSDSASIWQALNPKGTPVVADIDRECRSDGALVIRAIPGLGLVLMRLKYRQEEALEETANRSFPLAQILLFNGIEYWRDIPPGLFSWAWAELRTLELVIDAPETLPPFEVSIKQPERHTVVRMTTHSNRFSVFYRKALHAVVNYKPGVVSLPVNPNESYEESEPHYSDWIATLDVVALSAHLSAKRSGGGFIDTPVNIAVGLSPKRAQMGLCFSSSVNSSLKPAPSDSAEINELETHVKDWSRSTGPKEDEETILSASGRRIGFEPIPFGWASQVKKPQSG